MRCSQSGLFSVKVLGGERMLQDPDGLIYDIRWVTVEELNEMELSFPEDREFLIESLTRQEDV